MTSTADRNRARRASGGRARRGDGPQLREEILDAAERLLIERGSMDAVPIRAVATAVGVTAPSIYLHFDDKDGLFFAVCTRRFTEFGAALVSALDGIEDTVAQVQALGRAYIKYGLSHPQQYPVLFSGEIDVSAHTDDVSTLPGYQALQLLIDVVDRGMREGVLAPGDPAHVAVGLWSTTHGYVSLMLTQKDHHPGIDLEGASEAVLRQAISGIVARS
jgi:AcrR family transcriptional regulator